MRLKTPSNRSQTLNPYKKRLNAAYNPFVLFYETKEQLIFTLCSIR